MEGVMTPRVRDTHWLAKARFLSPPTFVLALFLVPLLLGDTCLGPDTAPNDVRTIEGFVQCLNHRIIGGNIVDAVQCLPCNCTLTLTLNDGSAQPACNDQGCPMPRVLLNCPGPPQFQPSFSLCITGSGLDRVEIGETINAAGDMRMGDVHVDPNGYASTDPSEPVSKVDENGNDTAQCWNCHDSTAAPQGAEAISGPLSNFGRNCVTDTDEACQKPDVEDGNCHDQGNLERKTFAEICQCLDDKVLAQNDPLYPKLVRSRALCHALKDYRATRGICGSEDCPRETGPDCSALATGVSCDPYQLPAAASETATGYTCQEVTSGGLKQCLSSRMCVDYSVAGGGKFIGDDGVSLLRLLISGRAAVDNCPICDSTEIDAEISAFNHAADMLANSFQLSSVQATDLGGGDLTVEATGTASVDGGGPTNISLDASKTSGTPAFDLEDTDAPAGLAGGTGEAGRSDFQLNQTPIP
jgi:hypothetical protein